jgi:formate/nitrite transporter FocA (FNT family)
MKKTPPNDLSPDEEKQAKELASVRAPIIHEVVRREGIEELERSGWGLLWSSLAAGLCMGFSMVAEGLLRAHLPQGAPWIPIVAKLGYPVGFVLVILGKQQLYTENTLTPVVPFMAEPRRDTLLKLLRLWGIVLAGNVTGACLFAWACASSPVFDSATQDAFLQIGRDGSGAGFSAIFLKGIFGGWLIAMIGWILGGIKGGELAVIFLLAYLVGLGGFSHSVAGSVDTLFLVFQGQLTLSGYFGGFLVPAVLGNTVGGVALVALANHAQVRAS